MSMLGKRQAIAQLESMQSCVSCAHSIINLDTAAMARARLRNRAFCADDHIGEWAHVLEPWCATEMNHAAQPEGSGSC